VRGELQEIQVTGITQAKAKFQTDRRRLIQSGIKVLNERLSHTITCGVMAACPVFDTVVTLPTGSEMRCFGNSEIHTLTFHFHHLHSL
jgi:hypothetical protein